MTPTPYDWEERQETDDQAREARNACLDAAEEAFKMALDTAQTRHGTQLARGLLQLTYALQKD